MRVSKAFKVMAAPLLYERLEWKYMQKDPLRLEKDGGVIRGGSDITTKESEFQYIKLIEIHSHWKDECPCIDTRTCRGLLTVPILQVVMQTEDDRYGDEVICLGSVNCPLMYGLMPSKVVKMSAYTYPSIGLGHINRHTINDYVVHLDMSHLGQLIHLNNHIQGRPQRLTKILMWDELIVRHLPAPPWFDQSIRHSMKSLAAGLSTLGRRPHCLSEIVLVNTDFWEEKFMNKTAFPKGCFERLCRTAVESFDPNSALPAGDGKRWRTAAEAAMVSYEFVTMEDYVKNYDRKGEYTNEEFERMLCGYVPLSYPAYKWW
jgi:hypothetical protein